MKIQRNRHQDNGKIDEKFLPRRNNHQQGCGQEGKEQEEETADELFADFTEENFEDLLDETGPQQQ